MSSVCHKHLPTASFFIGRAIFAFIWRIYCKLFKFSRRTFFVFLSARVRLKNWTDAGFASPIATTQLTTMCGCLVATFTDAGPCRSSPHFWFDFCAQKKEAAWTGNTHGEQRWRGKYCDSRNHIWTYVWRAFVMWRLAAFIIIFIFICTDLL